jgi:hypothetical protein
MTIANTLATVLFVVVGVVNLLPVGGALSAYRLESLYGVSLADPNVVVLMRHRAVLFGVVGAFLFAAAVRAPLRPLAVVVGLVSMLSFVVIAHAVGGFNAELRRVVVIDLVASLLLIGAGLITLRSSSGPSVA